jgi:GNAT superfamily N-acetyltransferase
MGNADVMLGSAGPRLAVKADLEALREVVDAAYRKYLARMDRPPGPMLEDLLPLIEAQAVWVLGRPIRGLICLIAEEESLLVEIVAVHPDAQGTGQGRQLIEFAQDQVRKIGVPRLWLYTNEAMTENVSLYVHLGFREFDRRRQAGYDRIFMEKLLPPA